MKTKLFTLLITLVASTGMAYATIYHGTCGATGNNLTWSLNTEDSTLIIEGSGAMGDFPWNSYLGGYTTPWYEYRNYIAHVSLSNELTTIGKYAFADCYRLTTITIPENVISIGANAFQYLHLNSVHITSLSSWCNIEFAYYDSNPLYSAHHLYLNGTEITDLVIPDDVTNINNFAFGYCEGLTSVTLPDSVLSIGNQAFSNCTNITNVSVGNGVTTIGDQAFKDCSNLTNLMIGDSVASIGDKAFENCNNLMSVTLNSNAICSVDYWPMKGVQKIFGTQVQEYIIGEKVNRIGNYFCYTCKNLTNVIIGNNVIAIGESAFSGCSNLTSVTIGNSVEEIGDIAFDGCSSLTSVILPESLTSVGSNVFSHCGFTSIDIPRSLINIGKAMFYGCTKLKNVTLHDSITSIGNGSFYQCDSINNILIPNSVTNIGTIAFAECKCLSNITLSNRLTSIENGVFRGCTKLTSINIPQRVKSIGESAFAMCGLTCIEIPDSVVSIKSSAFANCHGLTHIEIPNNVITIGNGAFKYCGYLETVMLGNSVDSIGGQAFAQCGNLKNINISDSLTYLGDSAFYYCQKLTHIKIPNKVTNIGKYTFGFCKSMTNITMSLNLESIGEAAFNGCSNLNKICLPASVSSIGRFAFSWCHKLRTVTCLGETPAILDFPSYMFENKDSLIVYIPCGALAAYQASDWNIYQLQYAPSEYDLQVHVKDQMGGSVQIESNSCASSITAIPNEGYRFDCWSDGNADNPREITLTQDTSFTAIFAVQTFTITFVDDNDTILSSQEVEYNTMPIIPADPIKMNDAQYSYTFAGWSPSIIPATEDATYKATYTATPKTEGVEDLNLEKKPQKKLENGNVYIIMPNGTKYSIIGNQIK